MHLYFKKNIYSGTRKGKAGAERGGEEKQRGK
jgi:hypothetical protein